MGRRPNFTREQILNCAFEMLNTEDLKAITARNIALKLGVSTIAIYTAFESMDELKNELAKKAKMKLFEYTQREYHTNLSIFNIGIGICLFAKEESELFRTIFLRESMPREFMDEVLNDFKKLIYNSFKNDKIYKNVSKEIVENIMKKGWYYSHGYATLICTEFYPDIQFETFKNEIIDMGNILLDSMVKKQKALENMKL